jgi:hypothetical protein
VVRKVLLDRQNYRFIVHVLSLLQTPDRFHAGNSEGKQDPEGVRSLDPD